METVIKLDDHLRKDHPGAEPFRCKEHPSWVPLGGACPWDILHCTPWWPALWHSRINPDPILLQYLPSLPCCWTTKEGFPLEQPTLGWAVPLRAYLVPSAHLHCITPREQIYNKTTVEKEQQHWRGKRREKWFQNMDTSRDCFHGNLSFLQQLKPVLISGSISNKVCWGPQFLAVYLHRDGWGHWDGWDCAPPEPDDTSGKLNWVFFPRGFSRAKLPWYPPHATEGMQGHALGKHTSANPHTHFSF